MNKRTPGGRRFAMSTFHVFSSGAVCSPIQTRKRALRSSCGLFAAAAQALAVSCLVFPSGGWAQNQKAQVGVSREAGKSDAAPGNEQSKLDIPRSTRPQISREEVQTLLPLFLRSSESRELATALEARLQRGDLAGAKQLLDGFVEASTFAVLASDWLQDSTFVGMLQANGIRSADRPPPSDAAAVQVRELQKALDQERERGQALAREKAAAVQELASLQAAQPRKDATASQVSELQKALERERERGQALARENAAASEKLASLQAAQPRDGTAAVQVRELQKA